MKRNKSTDIATIAIFFAIMVVIHTISTIVFSVFVVPIKPTIVHIPVIIASILYGPRIGMSLGTLMGLLSMVHNTIIQLPTSYLFSPLVENGSWASIVIAVLPRILIGLTPYYIYKLFHNRLGLIAAGVVGSMTNTIFVLGGIFILFSSVFSGDIQAMLATVFSTNAIAEMVISAILTVSIVPTLQKVIKIA